MKALLPVLLLLLTACSQVDLEAAQELAAGIPQNATVEEIVEEAAEIIEPPKSWTIVAFGDSLTEGYGVAANESYPAVLEQLLQERGYEATVINEGVSGETSAGSRARIEDVLAHTPDMVILETGVNDILNGVPVEETAANLEAIVRELQENNITVILAGMEAFGEFQGYSIRVQTMYPDIAEAYGTPFIPFFLQGVAGVPEYNLPDYVHPNAAGYRVITEQNVLPVVEAVIEGQ